MLNKIKSNVQADFISIRPALVFNLFDEIVAKRKPNSLMYIGQYINSTCTNPLDLVSSVYFRLICDIKVHIGQSSEQYTGQINPGAVISKCP